MTTLGPLVRRTARWGGAMFVIGSLQFLIAMIVVQLRYSGYSDLTNYVSDLGNPNMSPLSWLFNDSIRVLGVLAVLGTLFVMSAFSPRFSRSAGLGLLIAAGVGAFLVGTFPETSPQLNGNIHAVVSLITFVGSGFSLLFLAMAMRRDTRWEGFRGYTGISGLITLIALAVFIPTQSSGWPGFVERLIVAPILLWAIVAGIHLVRLPTFAPQRFLQHSSA